MHAATRADLVLPSFESVPPAASSYGEAAAELAASAGLFLDPWQAYALDRVLAEDDDGRPAAFECAVILPRQNGKGSILEALSLAWLFLTDVPLVLHSAHEFKTAAEGFRRLRALIQGAPHLAKRVERVTTAAGNEAIELTSGQRLRYVARSKGSGRGFTGGKLILDEAYAIDSEEMAALLPTLATQPEAQLVYTSSAGMVSSTHLRSIRDRGRRGNDPSLCYLEWGGTVACPDRCQHDLDDETCGLNDEGLWRAANPAVGIRIPIAFIANERRALAPDVFARERLGAWDESANDSPVSLALWGELADPGSQASGDVAVGFAIGPGLHSASVAVAAQREDGLTHVEVIQHEAGTDWLPAYLAGVVDRQGLARVYAPATAFVATVAPELKDAGVELELLPPRAMAAGCQTLAGEVEGSRLRHLGDPLLVQALAGAARKDVGDGAWMWSYRKSDVDISPLEAVTAARRGLAELGEAVGPMVVSL